MNKLIEVTAQQRANAVEALTVMWPSVPEANVAPKLLEWRPSDDALENRNSPPTCGTVACFGGWVECWPTFREQLELSGYFNDWDELLTLFGDGLEYTSEYGFRYDLFAIRGDHVADAHFTGSDHALVANRLRWLIANSFVTPPL